MPNYANTCRTCGKRYTWKGSIADEPKCPNCNPPKTSPQMPQRKTTTVRVANEPDDNAELAIELCDSILESVDELPERAEDFGESVAEKTKSIRATVEERGTATEGQITALENMKAGVERWFR